MTTPRRIVFCALSMMIGWLGSTSSASACSIACTTFSFGNELPTFPANLVRFRAAFEPLVPPQIADTAGVVVPSAIRKIGADIFLEPTVPLKVGATYRLKYDARCPMNPQSAQPMELTQMFAVRAAAVLPATVGDLTVTQRGVEFEGTQSMPTRFAFVRVRFQPPAGSSDLDIVKTIGAYADGESLGGFAYSGPDLLLKADCSNKTPIRDSCGTLATLSLGSHRIEMRVHILGETTDPTPVSVMVSLSCADPVATDGGTDRAADGGTDGAADRGSAPAPVGGGCTFGGNGNTRSGQALAGAALVLMVLRRRRP